MRFRLVHHVIGIAIVVFYILFCLSSVLLTLLEPTLPYLVTREELECANINGTQLTPRLLHQVYLGWDEQPMPKSWKASQQSCIDLHPDYEYKVNDLWSLPSYKCL